MLLTRECDYAIRIIRALSGGDIVNVQEISTAESISMQITYKLARKLEKEGIIQSFRGVKGGYALNRKLSQITIYDVLAAVGHKILITECVQEDYNCSQNKEKKSCMVHKEFCRLQGMIASELKAKTLFDIINE